MGLRELCFGALALFLLDELHRLGEPLVLPRGSARREASAAASGPRESAVDLEWLAF
jgi:hypothetical protein